MVSEIAWRRRDLEQAGRAIGIEPRIQSIRPPHSADRTRSPAAVSEKWEFFKYPPETIGYWAAEISKTGAWRLVPHRGKPAVGGPFRKYRGPIL